MNLFLARLKSVEEKSKNQWMALCPAHEDHDPSLSIGLSDSGKILLRCFAGCTAESIVAALGITTHDLVINKTIKSEIVAIYEYLNEAGDYLFEVCRYEPGLKPGTKKTFKQRRKIGQEKYEWNLNGTRRVLYHLPQLIAADINQWVFVVEGEKDVESLEKIGLIATCNSGGANNWKTLSDDNALHGRKVCVIMDKDDAGRKHGIDVCTRLEGKAAILKKIELPGIAIKDATDWIESLDSKTTEQMQSALIEIAESAPLWNDEEKTKLIPLLIRADELAADESLVEPIQIIKGVLHDGCKMIYGGPSKAYKSWILLDLCISIASGNKWLEWETTQAPSCYINLELPAWSIRQRLNAICFARGIAVPHDLHILNLRGLGKGIETIREGLKRDIGEGIKFIAIDPTYKLLQGRDENSATDMSMLCADIEGIAQDMQSAVGFAAHYAKGNASGKDHMDRMSGSGVLARDPDAILTATTHADEGSFVLDMTLRNLPPQKSIVITWQYPKFQTRNDLSVHDLKKHAGGAPQKYNVQQIMDLLPKEGLRSGEWQELVESEIGMSSGTFYAFRKAALADKSLIYVGGINLVGPKSLQ